MSDLFQIHEDELAELERTIPRIADELMIHTSPRTATSFRRIQKILSNVRWNYGPPSHVEIIRPGDPVGDEETSED